MPMSGSLRNEHRCPHDNQCPPDLSVPDVLIFCECGEMTTWHYCHYCCPVHGLAGGGAA